MRTAVLGQGTKAQRDPEAGQEWGVQDGKWMDAGRTEER